MTDPRPIMFGGVVFDNPYIEPPSVPPGMTLAEWSATHPRRRSFLRRVWRRVHGR